MPVPSEIITPVVRMDLSVYVRLLETLLEESKGHSGFLWPLCIHQKSHQPQTYSGGHESIAHLVILVVECDHGSDSFRDASDVTSTLRSPSSGRLIHEIIGKLGAVPEVICTVRRVLVVGGEYGLNRKINSIPVVMGWRPNYQPSLFFPDSHVTC